LTVCQFVRTQLTHLSLEFRVKWGVIYNTDFQYAHLSTFAIAPKVQHPRHPEFSLIADGHRSRAQDVWDTAPDPNMARFLQKKI